MTEPAIESTTVAKASDRTNNFGTTEIDNTTGGKSRPIIKFPPSAPNKPTLEEEADRCFRANGGNGLFASDNSKIAILEAAYGLALLLVDGGEASCKAILDHDYYLDRKRKPGVEKPYLIAIQLGAKPNCDQSHKVCSDYATVLEHAMDCAVSTNTFADWFLDTPVQACLKAVRAKRKSARAAIAGADEAPESPSLQDAVATGVVVPVDAEHSFIALAGRRATIVMPSLFGEALAEVLDDLESYSDEDMLHAFEMAVDLARQKMTSSQITAVGHSEAHEHIAEA